jgi:hypothetical protein
MVPAGPNDAGERPAPHEAFPRYAPPGPVEPVPQAFLEPMDMSSNVGQSPIQMTLHVSQGGRVSDELLAELPDQLSLVEWPEMTAVAVVKRTARAPEGAAVAASVAVIPARPLADRWYALRVARLPAGLSWPTFAPHRSLGEGAITRFRVGSDPQVASVRICAKDGASALIVDFSERLELADPKQVVVTYGDRSLPACEDWEPIGASGATSLVRRCVELDERRPLRVAIDHGALRSGALPRPVQMAVAEMPPWGDGCRIFRP